MKKVALIFAGGTGKRMGKDIPKQFLKIADKEIIIRTIEVFEKSDYIDEIYISCIKDWIDYLNDLLIKFNIKKVKKIVPGGTTGQMSIFNSLNAAYENNKEDEETKSNYKYVTWNLQSLYPSDEAWEKELSKFEKDISELDNYTGKLTKTKTHFISALKIKEKLDIKLEILYAYAKFMSIHALCFRCIAQFFLFFRSFSLFILLFLPCNRLHFHT